VVPGVEAGEAGYGAAGEGVDVDRVPHPRQVRHAVRGHLILLHLAIHGDHYARNRTARKEPEPEPEPAPARRSSVGAEQGQGGA
jgi:hypothetical protein